MIVINNLEKCMYLRSASAEPNPPLSTVLGNLGVQTKEFCKEFNEYTENLPNYFVLCVRITIHQNRTYKFDINIPSIGKLLMILSFERSFKIKVKDQYKDIPFLCIKLYDVIKLALFKYPDLSLIQSLPMVRGTIKSMNCKVIRNDLI